MDEPRSRRAQRKSLGVRASTAPFGPRITRWAIGNLPRRALALVMLVELLAVLLLVVDLAAVTIDVFDGARFVAFIALLGGGIVHTEVTARVENARTSEAARVHIDLSSVWAFAAAVLLPLITAAVLVAALLLYLYLRIWRPRNAPVGKQVFSAAAVVLAVHAARAAVAGLGGALDVSKAGGGVLDSFGGSSALVVGVLTYTVVIIGLNVGAIVLSTDDIGLQLAGRRQEFLLELAAAALGALVAAALTLSPLLVMFFLAPLVLLHRSVLDHQLAAAVDGATQPLTVTAWRHGTIHLR